MTRSLHRLPFALSLLALALTGCPADEVPADTESSTTGDGDGDQTGDGDGDATGDGDGDPTGDGDGDTSSCGDGVVDPGEACDDGNTADGDGCSSTCEVSSCGLMWETSVALPSAAAGANDVVMGPDGSIYAAGVSINADNDAWAAKWTADGTEAWSVDLDGGAGNDGFGAIALGAGGEVYVAGWQAGAGDDIWYAELSDADGSTVWDQVVVGPMMVMDGDDVATGVAVTPDGDLVVSGRIRAADMDNDVWVRKADATDGTEIWSSTWTGTGDGTFSTDRSGDVTVGSDGTVWVAAREHIAFDTQDATALQFDADGNFVAAYQPQAGGSHSHDPIDILATDGGIYFAFEDSDFPYRGWLYKLDTSGGELWSKTEADWIIVLDDDTMIGSDWQIAGLGLDTDGNLGVGGAFANEDAGQGLDWYEAWVAKLDSDGNLLCQGRHKLPDEAGLPPSLFPTAASYNSTGFGVVGVQTSAQGNNNSLWTGLFMP